MILIRKEIKIINYFNQKIKLYKNYIKLIYLLLLKVKEDILKINNKIIYSKLKNIKHAKMN